MIKKELQEDFDKLDEENFALYQRLRIFQMQNLICEQVRQDTNMKHLESMAAFCGELNNMELHSYGLDDMRFEPKK